MAKADFTVNANNGRVPKFPAQLPWYIFDIDNQQLITSVFIPSDIEDVKSIVLAEQPIPGLNYAPINSGGSGNRKISMTIPLVKRDGLIGNVLMLKQFDNLRQPSVGFQRILRKVTQFTPNPKVIYSWGIGSIPLIYYVSKCDFSHKQHWVNGAGNPQYTEISLELVLDEANIINRGEEVFRQLSSITASTLGVTDIIQSYLMKKPF